LPLGSGRTHKYAQKKSGLVDELAALVEVARIAVAKKLPPDDRLGSPAGPEFALKKRFRRQLI
jgi:hypothetical protein